jgi:hypothetical protein
MTTADCTKASLEQLHTRAHPIRRDERKRANLEPFGAIELDVGVAWADVERSPEE